MNLKSIIEPHPILMTLIPTHKCSAACDGCCFGCTPKIKHQMSYEEMVFHVDSAITAYPSIRVLVISGGECTLLGNDLDKIIAYGTQRGLRTRIVSNASWAKSYDDAYCRMMGLVKAGLCEFNVSTGKQHQKFVPLQNIIYAILAANNLGISPVQIAYVGTVLSSIILQSCTFDTEWYNNKDNIYGDISLSPTDKVDLLNIGQLRLSETLIEYSKAISAIFEDITTNHDAAQAFCENPDAYIANRFPQTRSSNLHLDLSDREKKILMAMTDEQVQNAIKSRDFSTFIHACVQKGYFASAEEILTVNVGDTRKFFASDEDYERYKEMLQRINSDNTMTRASDPESENFAIGVPVVAVGFIAVEIGGFVDMAIKVHQYGATTRSASIGAQNEPVINLWYRENEETTTDDKIIFL